MTDKSVVSRFRLGLALWLAGMLGAVVITFTVLPQLLRELVLPAPLWVISLASLGQSAVLLGLAVWGGVSTAPAVDLHAPAFEAAVTARPIMTVLRPQQLPGFISGLLGGLRLFFVNRHAPEAFIEVQALFNPPILARVLYGGFTEELLLRWGLMTAFVWLAWRFLQHRRGAPRAGYVWLAIVLSAVLFGAGHLPAGRPCWSGR